MQCARVGAKELFAECAKKAKAKVEARNMLNPRDRSDLPQIYLHDFTTQGAFLLLSIPLGTVESS